ncbi:MAG: hypothetical protein IJ471_06495 [Eubacterium sp.]|nr:hypothetical protein [Eubacterium sp.]
MKKTKKGKKNTWIIIVAPMVAAVLFVGIFLTIEKKVLSNYEVKTVVTARVEIEEGTQVTKENVNALFTTTEMKTEYVIDNAIVNQERLIGHVIENRIHAREMVSSTDVTDRQAWMESLKQPVEFTFTASSVAASVGGSIRGGDVIDVGITMQKADGTAHFASIGRNIYVKEAYNEKGTAIPRSDKETICTMFRVVMEQTEGEVFLERLRAGDEVIVTLPK